MDARVGLRRGEPRGVGSKAGVRVLSSARPRGEDERPGVVLAGGRRAGTGSGRVGLWGVPGCGGRREGEREEAREAGRLVGVPRALGTEGVGARVVRWGGGGLMMARTARRCASKSGIVRRKELTVAARRIRVWRNGEAAAGAMSGCRRASWMARICGSSVSSELAPLAVRG